MSIFIVIGGNAHGEVQSNRHHQSERQHGKTTTAVNLGVGLANMGKRVLLVDANPQDSLTVSLGMKNSDDLPITLATAMQCVTDDLPLPEERGILSGFKGVDLVPSNIEMSVVEVGLLNRMSREFVLRDYLKTVKPDYDYILIDSH